MHEYSIITLATDSQPEVEDPKELDLDGAPIEDLDGAPIEGVKVSEIDGKPIVDYDGDVISEDLDGEPCELATQYMRCFARSA